MSSEKSKLKILFVVTKGNWGGVQRYVYDLATNLPEKSFEVTVVVGEGAILPLRLTEAGVRNISLPSLGRDVKLRDDLKTFFTLRRLFRDEKPNIIHLNSSKVGAMGALAGRIYNLTAKSYKLKATIIFTAHGWAFNENRSKISKIIIAFLHWLTVILAHQTIVVAETTRRQMRRFPFTKRRMTVINNGLSDLIFFDRRSARRELLGEIGKSSDQSFWLGTISELHPNKGLQYLIQAVKILNKSLTVVIIGEGEERGALEKYIKHLGLERQIHLVGQKDNASKYLKAFDLFTLTSITEAFPYVILEAGVAGLPVVASGVGGIPEIITSMQSGILVKPRHPNEIAKAVEFLLTYPDKARQFGQELEQRVKKNFSTAKMVKETISVYNHIDVPSRS